MKKRINKKVFFLIILDIFVVAFVAIGAIILATSFSLENREYISTMGRQKEEIAYNGQTYRYNKNIVTILLLGIDIRETDENKTEEIVNIHEQLGQADAVVLAVIDMKKDTVNFVMIPRDVMVPVKTNGMYSSTDDIKNMQLTLQYPFADSKTEGCELMEEQVSNIFHQQPINAYYATNLIAIQQINDAVGGVPVTIEEDLTMLNPKFVKGESIVLYGQDASDFLHGRDITQAETSLRRNNRHIQYVKSFITQAKAAWEKDWKLPSKVYNMVSENSTTNLNDAQILLLSEKVAKAHITQENFHVLDVMVEHSEKYEEYYIKEDALQELIIDLFYEKEK